jgi:hypothetical protein
MGTYLTESSIKEIEEIKSKLETYKYQTNSQKYDDTIFLLQNVLDKLEEVLDFEKE